jgi:hypothetical protein
MSAGAVLLAAAQLALAGALPFVAQARALKSGMLSRPGLWHDARTCLNDEPCAIFDDDHVDLITLDASILRAVRLTAKQPLMRQYQPSSAWMRSQWQGTILPVGLRTALYNIIVGSALALVTSTCGFLAIPDPAHTLMARLLSLDGFWEKQVA